MPKLAILFGIILIGQGLYGYLFPSSTGSAADTAATATDVESAKDDGGAEGAETKGTSITALIPAFVGFPLLLCGLGGLAGGKARMHAMHVAAMIGVLGALAGLGRGLMVLAKLMGGSEVNQRAMTMTLIMGVICALFTYLCVKSFIAARKAREAEASSGAANAAG